IVGASLLVRSLNQLLDVEPGFRADHLLVAKVALPASRYRQTDVHNFYVRLLPRIAAIPGVLNASVSTDVPLASPVKSTRFSIPGSTAADPRNYPVTAFATVDPEFFKTMGIPIIRGRTFQPREVGNERDERCIINNALARTFFNVQDPIGRTITTFTPEVPCRIVGVVGDTRVGGLDKPVQPVLYYPAYVAKALLIV